MCGTGDGLYGCESLFKICHTNEFVGKRFFALEAVLPSFGPKWGRWVYEKAKIPKAEGRLGLSDLTLPTS